ncbi:MAG: hypothetical protein JWM47_4546 [Acidimicrobiales bacterium]|nr:hypothetical protein [Acidimicrobiales bacterium]
MADIPHFKFPFQRSPDGKTVDVVEQDTVEHVMTCEEVIVRCPLGFRIERPEFGWPFPEFQTGDIDLSALEAALADLEPRGSANSQQWADVVHAAVRHIEVEVQTG